MTRQRRSVALAGLAIAAGCALAGCSMLGLDSNEKELSFDSYADAPQRGDQAFVPSSFIPPDAENLRIRAQTDGSGSVVSYKSPSEPLGDGCQPGSFSEDPPLRARWWPTDVPADGLLCGDWGVFEKEGTTYAFRG